MTIGSTGIAKKLHDFSDGTYGDAIHLESAAVAVNVDLDVEASDLGAAAEGAALGNGVLMQGDDGTDRQNVQLDASGNLKAILQANSGVDIGDVDVTSVVHPTALATVSHGERAGSVTAVQLATVSTKFVRIKACVSNVGNVYVGSSNAVTKVAGTTTTTAGFELAPGDDTGWLPASNLNLFWIIGDNAGDDIAYMVIA